MLNWLQNLRYRIDTFWCLREKASCDQCSGVFRRRNLTPTSGDWWLCDSCFSSLMADMAKDAQEHQVRGKAMNNSDDRWRRVAERIEVAWDLALAENTKLREALKAAEEECAQWRWIGTQTSEGWIGQFYWNYGDRNDVTIRAANRNDDTRKRLGLDSIKPESGGYMEDPT